MTPNRLIAVLVLMALMSAQAAYGGEDQLKNGICTMSGTQDPLPLINFGGRYFTPSGTVRMLVVFVRFADDNEVSATWPDPQILPLWARQLVDTSYRANGSYTQGRCSKWFWENSGGRLHIIGDVFYLTADYPESHYHQLASSSSPTAARGAIEAEAFNKLDSPPYSLDFRRYDNWSFGTFSHPPTPDNELDMCLVMTRNLHDADFPIGQRFGIGQAQLEGQTLKKDGVDIVTGFPGSGIGGFGQTLLMPPSSFEATDGAYTVVSFIAHEFTHYFFGYNHFAKFRNEAGPTELRIGSRSCSNMTHYVGGWKSHYSGYEKARLTWLSASSIATVSTNTTIVLSDQASTLDSTKLRLIKIPIAGTTQAFYLENRRQISGFEARHAHLNGSNASMSPGVLVYHVMNDVEYLSETQVTMRAADGKWFWSVLNCGGIQGTQCDDEIDKLTADGVSGYDENEYIYISGACPGPWWKAIWWGDVCAPTHGGYRRVTNFRGESLAGTDDHGDRYDLFDLGDVITMYSNPTSHKWDATGGAFVATSIGIEISGYNATTQAYTIKINMSNPQDLSPCKVQDLVVTPVQSAGDWRPRLTWSQALEPDVVTGGSILIERRRKVGSGSWTTWSQIAQLAGNATSYDDRRYLTTGEGPDSLQYRIRKKDSQAKYSVYSPVVSIQYDHSESKVGVKTEVVPASFELCEAYPNPFNPTTTIRFGLPVQSHVSLRVYTALGEEVESLVDGALAEGYHEVQFDASSLAGGVYFYRIQAGDYLQTRKLVLVR